MEIRDIVEIAATLSGISLVAFLAWIARRLTDRPRVTVSAKPDTPWQGWTTLQVVITSPADTEFHVTGLRVPRWSRLRLVPVAAAQIIQTATEIAWITGEPVERRSAHFPALPPDLAGQRRLTGFGMKIAPKGGRARRITVLAPPVNGRAPKWFPVSALWTRF